MKSVKSFAIVALVAIIAVACGKAEKILPKGDGLWQGVSSHTITYLNGTETSNETDLDSLGTTYFDKEGTGYSTAYGSTTKSNFTWTVTGDNDILTITSTDSGAVPMNIDIIEIDSKEMTLHSDQSSGTAPFIVRVENTSVLERVK